MYLKTIRLIMVFVFVISGNHAFAEAMIYKCKSPEGATVYKKAPCDDGSDTVSTFTPKEQKKPELTEAADTDKKADKGPELKLKQNGSGHYLTEGNVDGRPVIFVVDTGASHLSLPEKDAHDAQIYCDKNIDINTANGKSSSCTATAKRLQFGPFVVENVELVIAPNLTQPLLGMNILQLFKIAQDKGEMTISMRDKEQKEGKDKEAAKQP